MSRVLSVPPGPAGDPSPLTRGRKRIGEEGVERLLTRTNEAGKSAGAINDKSLGRVIVDSTVMEKNIPHPADARLFERSRQRLVKLAARRDCGFARAMHVWRPAWHGKPAAMPMPVSSSACARHRDDCISKGKAHGRDEFGCKVRPHGTCPCPTLDVLVRAGE